ncbi:hypothetical protein GOBAR_AA20141 [Gossypium barbadense]|uniref:Uncharacterized protein n=1 Tax=Gossypium barbadense TaxID=3634 RepID=A0A2P5XB01_GOSBA|nr:hypothetical protein GOBAR_AA20141 [Gossypium barbadense]
MAKGVSSSGLQDQQQCTSVSKAGAQAGPSVSCWWSTCLRVGKDVHRLASDVRKGVPGEVHALGATGRVLENIKTYVIVLNTHSKVALLHINKGPSSC